MKKLIVLFTVLFTSIAAHCQILDTDEKIEILGLGSQSTAVINAAAEADYTLEELEQANEIKKAGLKDEVIVLVLKERARLSAEEIKKLKDYQDKNYSLSIITKSVQEKSKFSTPEKIVSQTSASNQQPQNNNSEKIKKFGIPIDPNTGKITFENYFEIKGITKDAFVKRASDWAKSTTKQWSAGKETESESPVNAKLWIDLPPQIITATGKNTKSTTLSFSAVIKCRDNQYSYRLTDFILEYKADGLLFSEKAEELKTIDPEKIYPLLSQKVNEAVQKIKDKMTAVNTSPNINW